MSSNLKDMIELFSNSMFDRMRPYAPNENLSHRPRTISGRLLEEMVEMHLAAGGSPNSAMAHVLDAITNESFKIQKNTSDNQKAYPSNYVGSYNREDTVVEASDVLFIYMVNLIVNNISFEELKDNILLKIEKLEQAEKEGKLIRTTKGLFYIKKD